VTRELQGLPLSVKKDSHFSVDSSRHGSVTKRLLTVMIRGRLRAKGKIIFTEKTVVCSSVVTPHRASSSVARSNPWW